MPQVGLRLEEVLNHKCPLPPQLGRKKEMEVRQTFHLLVLHQLHLRRLALHHLELNLPVQAQKTPHRNPVPARRNPVPAHRNPVLAQPCHLKLEVRAPRLDHLKLHLKAQLLVCNPQ